MGEQHPQPKGATRAVPGEATATVRDALNGPAASDTPAKGLTLLNARTASEVIKAQLGKVRLSQIKGDLVNRSQAIAHVFALARAERDALLNWPADCLPSLRRNFWKSGSARTPSWPDWSAGYADYLQTLGDIRPKVD